MKKLQLSKTTITRLSSPEKVIGGQYNFATGPIKDKICVNTSKVWIPKEDD